jgi:hypothetical protein
MRELLQPSMAVVLHSYSGNKDNAGRLTLKMGKHYIAHSFIQHSKHKLPKDMRRPWKGQASSRGTRVGRETPARGPSAIYFHL